MSPLEPMALLQLAALLAATAVGLTLVMRRLPPFASWVAREIKPWACNLCCATWSTLALTAAWALVHAEPAAAFAWLPALALATWGLHVADPPPPPSFDDLMPAPLEEPGPES